MLYGSKFSGTPLLLLLLLFSACSHRVSIEAINHDPTEFRSKEISVAGRVANSFVEGNAAAFELDDGTGRLWVLRENTNVPAPNSSVRVTGKIEQALPFAGRNFVVILRETPRQ